MKNIIFNNYIIEPSSELRPVIRISPFINDYLQSKNSSKAAIKEASKFLDSKFQNYRLTLKGRLAISVALSSFNLSKEDVVTILTSSDNFYISGCVTREIEKHCLWSRDFLPQTKVIFVNHEFGYPYPNIRSLKKYNLPIIEDCAHTFFSENENIGEVGDFIIYSLPKAFPIQLGGVLVSSKIEISSLFQENQELDTYILSHLSSYINKIDSIKECRLSNYQYLATRLSSIEIKPYFLLDNGVIPGVFLFRWLDNMDYSLLKKFMQSNGVESSVFYGENAFFIPCHDGLTEIETDYMCCLLEFYYKKMKI